MPMYAMLRVCERFKITPWELDQAGADWVSVLVEYERVRGQEEVGTGH